MRSSKIILSILSILGACALIQRVYSQSLAQSKRIVIAASGAAALLPHVGYAFSLRGKKRQQSRRIPRQTGHQTPQGGRAHAQR